jgi:gas vesicle protein
MQAAQTIWDMTTRADNISTLIVGVLVVLFVAGKVGIDMWQKRKKKTKEFSPKEEKYSQSVLDSGLNSLEIVTETYIEIIKRLREEVNKLREDVNALGQLKVENEKLQREIDKLNLLNNILTEANKKQEKKINNLTVRVNGLAKSNSKKQPNRR